MGFSSKALKSEKGKSKQLKNNLTADKPVIQKKKSSWSYLS